MSPKITKTDPTSVELAAIKVRAAKVAIIKAWAPIITSIIALIGSIIVAWISASAAKLDNVVTRLDDKLIPKLEAKVDAIEKNIAELNVYKHISEQVINHLQAKHGAGTLTPLTVKLHKAKTTPPIRKFKLPRIQQRIKASAPLGTAAMEAKR